MLEGEIKREFWTSFCEVGIKQARRASETVREDVRYVPMCRSDSFTADFAAVLRSLKISVGLRHKLSSDKTSLHDLISMYPNTETFHVSWSFNHKKPKPKLPATPAFPNTSFPKITSLTLDFHGQTGEQAFGTLYIPLILRHLRMPNVCSFELDIQPSDQRQFVSSGEWAQVQKVCEWIKLLKLESFHLGLQIPVFNMTETSIWVSKRFGHSDLRTQDADHFRVLLIRQGFKTLYMYQTLCALVKNNPVKDIPSLFCTNSPRDLG